MPVDQPLSFGSEVFLILLVFLACNAIRPKRRH